MLIDDLFVSAKLHLTPLKKKKLIVGMKGALPRKIKSGRCEARSKQVAIDWSHRSPVEGYALNSRL